MPLGDGILPITTTTAQAGGDAVARKKFVLRKLEDASVEPLCIARLNKVWDHEKRRAVVVDLSAHEGLELFSEHAP